MKSIIQEGSSIWRAIEQAWKQAGMPKEFSIKIYEDAQKILFVFTKKPAKIGFFFEETRQKKPHGRRPKGRHPKHRDRKERSEQASTAGTDDAQTKEAETKSTHRGPRRSQRPFNRGGTPKNKDTSS